MSKSLIKLIDAALIPAAVMILGKVFGLWFANIAFSLNWGITTDPNNFFSVKIVYETIAEQIIATSYSNLVMYLSVFIGFSIILMRAVYFHSSHISPSMISKLATNNLLGLISDSFGIYHKASVWLIMLWISFIALIVNVILGRAFVWTGIVSFLCSLFTTIILIRDLIKEIDIARKNIKTLA
jgi:hypothetical protein